MDREHIKGHDCGKALAACGRMHLKNSMRLPMPSFDFLSLELRVNTRRKHYYLQELTIEAGLTRGNRGV